MNTSAHDESPIESRDLLKTALSGLDNHLIVPGKKQARKRFKKLLESESQFVTEITLQDGSEVRVMLSLDYSEFRGKLFFKKFKKFLSQLVSIVAKAVEDPRDIPLRQEQQGRRYMINIPAVLRIDDQVNVLILGMNLQNTNEIIIELLFFEPTQFEDLTKIANR